MSGVESSTVESLYAEGAVFLHALQRVLWSDVDATKDGGADHTARSWLADLRASPTFNRWLSLWIIRRSRGRATDPAADDVQTDEVLPSRSSLPRWLESIYPVFSSIHHREDDCHLIDGEVGGTAPRLHFRRLVAATQQSCSAVVADMGNLAAIMSMDHLRSPLASPAVPPWTSSGGAGSGVAAAAPPVAVDADLAGASLVERFRSLVKVAWEKLSHDAQRTLHQDVGRRWAVGTDEPLPLLVVSAAQGGSEAADVRRAIDERRAAFEGSCFAGRRCATRDARLATSEGFQGASIGPSPSGGSRRPTVGGAAISANAIVERGVHRSEANARHSATLALLCPLAGPAAASWLATGAEKPIVLSGKTGGAASPSSGISNSREHLTRLSMVMQSVDALIAQAVEHLRWASPAAAIACTEAVAFMAPPVSVHPEVATAVSAAHLLRGCAALRRGGGGAARAAEDLSVVLQLSRQRWKFFPPSDPAGSGPTASSPVSAKELAAKLRPGTAALLLSGWQNDQRDVLAQHEAAALLLVAELLMLYPGAAATDALLSRLAYFVAALASRKRRPQSQSEAAPLRNVPATTAASLATTLGGYAEPSGPSSGISRGSDPAAPGPSSGAANGPTGHLRLVLLALDAAEMCALCVTAPPRAFIESVTLAAVTLRHELSRLANVPWQPHHGLPACIIPGPATLDSHARCVCSMELGRVASGDIDAITAFLRISSVRNAVRGSSSAHASLLEFIDIASNYAQGLTLFHDGFIIAAVGVLRGAAAGVFHSRSPVVGSSSAERRDLHPPSPSLVCDVAVALADALLAAGDISAVEAECLDPLLQCHIAASTHVSRASESSPVNSADAVSNRGDFGSEEEERATAPVVGGPSSAPVAGSVRTDRGSVVVAFAHRTLQARLWAACGRLSDAIEILDDVQRHASMLQYRVLASSADASARQLRGIALLDASAASTSATRTRPAATSTSLAIALNAPPSAAATPRALPCPMLPLPRLVTWLIGALAAGVEYTVAALFEDLDGPTEARARAVTLRAAATLLLSTATAAPIGCSPASASEAEAQPLLPQCQAAELSVMLPPLEAAAAFALSHATGDAQGRSGGPSLLDRVALEQVRHRWRALANRCRPGEPAPTGPVPYGATSSVEGAYVRMVAAMLRWDAPLLNGGAPTDPTYGPMLRARATAGPPAWAGGRP